MGVPDYILHKPEQLTEEEQAIMQKHPQLAYDMLEPIAYLRDALNIPYCHHEKWDGTGYPRPGGDADPARSAALCHRGRLGLRSPPTAPYRKSWPRKKR